MDDYRPISPKELERGYFLVTHRLLIKKIILISVIVLLAIFYAFLIFQAVSYFRAPSFDVSAQNITKNNFDWETFHKERAPQNLLIDKPEFISLGDRKYNLTVLIENPNTDWAIKSLDYHFVSQDEDTPTRKAFINPQEKRLLTLTGYESSKAVRNPELVISNIKWYRVDNTFPQIDIKLSNINFQAASRQTVDGVTSELPARVSWQAYNDSVYNFWEVGWQIALYNGDKLVAFNELNTKDFLSLSTRNLETVWLNGLPRVTKAVIFPIINKLDSGIFKYIYVEPTGDSR